MSKTIEILDVPSFMHLGMQPIANGFSDTYEEAVSLPRLPMEVSVVSNNLALANVFPKEDLFNENYPYRSSGSNTMKAHFEAVAKDIAGGRYPCKPDYVVEIGSNDGVFIKHFPPDICATIEPCLNFADITNSMGYPTVPDFLTAETVQQVYEILRKQGATKDSNIAIFAANCLNHIPDIDQALRDIAWLLAMFGDQSFLVFEDPSLSSMMHAGAYDQLYDEHPHVFSATGIAHILVRAGLSPIGYYKLDVHGGSHRVLACLDTSSLVRTSPTMDAAIAHEKGLGMHHADYYMNFDRAVNRCSALLVEKLRAAKDAGKKVIGYGATAKSTTVYNYCNIGPDLIEHIVDITPEKIGKYSPGVGIPIVEYVGLSDPKNTLVYLAAWNFRDEIMKKEQEFLDGGGQFIDHIELWTEVKNELSIP